MAKRDEVAASDAAEGKAREQERETAAVDVQGFLFLPLREVLASRRRRSTRSFLADADYARARGFDIRVRTGIAIWSTVQRRYAVPGDREASEPGGI